MKLSDVPNITSFKSYQHGRKRIYLFLFFLKSRRGCGTLISSAVFNHGSFSSSQLTKVTEDGLRFKSRERDTPVCSRLEYLWSLMHSTAHLVDKYRVPLRERGLFVPLSDKIYIIYRTTDRYIIATTPTRIHSLIDCAKLDAIVWHRSELFAAETSVKQRRSFVFRFHELHIISLSGGFVGKLYSRLYES